jgi:hypothetical protein
VWVVPRLSRKKSGDSSRARRCAPGFGGRARGEAIGWLSGWGEPQRRTSEGGSPAEALSVRVVGRGCGDEIGVESVTRFRAALRAWDRAVGGGGRWSDRCGPVVRGERGRLGLAAASVSSIGNHARGADPRSVSGATRLESGRGIRQKRWLGSRTRISYTATFASSPRFPQKRTPRRCTV